jgi:hypothetical protein
MGMKQEYKTLVEQYLQEETKILGQKPVPLYPPQIAHALVWD